jgi:hypothetical protein
MSPKSCLPTKIYYVLFTPLLRIFHLYGDVTIVGERAEKIRLMLGVQGL